MTFVTGEFLKRVFEADSGGYQRIVVSTNMSMLRKYSRGSTRTIP